MKRTATTAKPILKILSILAILAQTMAFAQEKGSFVDARDKKTYKTVKIGKQVWMAENLNYDVKGSKCYEDKPENCQKYGRLYNWETALKACPAGWHLPANKEWDTLSSYVQSNKGCKGCDAKHLKAASGWNSCAASGSTYSCLDTYGFAALPGGYGYGRLSNDLFYSAGDHGSWWSSSERNEVHAYLRFMYFYYEFANLSNNKDKKLLYSARCLQD